jgi:3-mercaptopyruvate sulfurtransferase SseA
VALELMDQGVKQAMALDGGWQAWQDGDYPVEARQ